MVQSNKAGHSMMRVLTYILVWVMSIAVMLVGISGYFIDGIYEIHKGGIDEIKALITDSSIIDNDGTVASQEIILVYKVKNKEYTVAIKVNIHLNNNEELYKTGDTIDIKYSKSNPDKVVISRQYYTQMVMVITGLALLICMVVVPLLNIAGNIITGIIVRKKNGDKAAITFKIVWRICLRVLTLLIWAGIMYCLGVLVGDGSITGKMLIALGVLPILIGAIRLIIKIIVIKKSER